MQKQQMAAMFDSIAPRYDFLNTFLSFGIHVGWRKKAISLLKKDAPKRILDIATGTADFAIESLSLKPDSVVGVDLSEGMLRLGQAKLAKKNLGSKIQLIQGDSENLPFEKDSFDAVTVGFGVRNFENLNKGLTSICRVLRPGGILVILEFSKPTNSLIKSLYRFYFGYLTPFIGRLFSKDSLAYSYLPESVYAFPDGQDFLDLMKKNGFSDNKQLSLTFNIASIYVGKK